MAFGLPAPTQREVERTEEKFQIERTKQERLALKQTQLEKATRKDTTQKLSEQAKQHEVEWSLEDIATWLDPPPHSEEPLAWILDSSSASFYATDVSLTHKSPQEDEGQRFGESGTLDLGGEFIYVLANSSMPGLCKIGKTTRDPEVRVNELSASTGVPTPFILVWTEKVSDCSEAERLIHEKLANSRQSNLREFFCIDVQDAIVAVKEACESLRGSRQ